jgi:hypothetical protein
MCSRDTCGLAGTQLILEELCMWSLEYMLSEGARHFIVQKRQHATQRTSSSTIYMDRS